MIRYPDDIKAEMLSATKAFLASINSEDYENMPEEERVGLIDEYVFNHVSERAKAFLSDVKAIRAAAKKRGIQV